MNSTLFYLLYEGRRSFPGRNGGGISLDLQSRQREAGRDRREVIRLLYS
jgi:hypothetical protein